MQSYQVKNTYRYVIVKVNTHEQLETCLEKAVLELWGLRGLAETGLNVVYIDERKGLAVIRVRREGLHLLRAALAAYPKPIVRIIKVAGTLRKAEKIAESLSTVYTPEV